MCGYEEAPRVNVPGAPASPAVNAPIGMIRMSIGDSMPPCSLPLTGSAYCYRLPAHLTGAPVLTQDPEYHRKSDYAIDQLTEAMRDHDGSLPIEWEWASSLDHIVRVENCGILGGQDAPFLSHYARTALAVVQSEGNGPAMRSLSVGFWHNCAVEQFLLAACIGFHATRPDSPYHGVRVAHLFPSWNEANDANHAARVGYTHLMGGKRIPDAGQRLAERVRRDWPDFHRRCERMAERMSV